MPHPVPPPAARPSTVRAGGAAALGALLGVLSALAPCRSWSQTAGPAGATQVRAWTLCATTPLSACTSVELATTALFGAGAARTGTAFDVYIRNLQGTDPRDQSYAHAVEGVAFEISDALYEPPRFQDGLAPVAAGGAPAWDGAIPWGAETSRGLVNLTVYDYPPFDPALPRIEAPVIAGCTRPADGTYYNYYATLATCGAGQYYGFHFASATVFDAALVDLVFATNQGRAGPGPTTDYPIVTCLGPGPFSPAGCTVEEIAPFAAPGTAVPEPATLALTAAGLGGVASVARWRRRSSREGRA